MSNEAESDVGKAPGEFDDLEFRGGDMEEMLSNILDRRPRPPNTRSGNEWVRIKAASESRRRR